MNGASLSLQKAIYAQLTADTALQGEIGSPARLYDDPPEDTLFPYMTIGETRTRSFAGIDGALEHDIRLYAHSRYAGRLEVKRIMGAVYDALQDAPLTLDQHHLVSLRFTFGDAFRRQDGESYRALTRFRAVTQPQ